MSQILTTKRYGYTRSEIHNQMINSFSLEREFLHLFPIYHLKYWTAQYAKEKLSNSLGFLEHEDIKYQITFIGKKSLGHLKNLIIYTPEAQVALSFRAAKKEYNLCPVVLVSLPSTSQSAI